MIAGVDALSLSVMIEMKNAGIDVVGMALPPVSPVTGNRYSPADTIASLTDLTDLAPSSFVRTFGKIALARFPRLIARALRLNFLKVNGVPIHLRKSVVKIEGEQQVEAVMLQSVSVDGDPVGEMERVEVDAVCLAAGLYPLVDIAETVGCPLIDIPELGGTVPLHGPNLSTQVNGLFVAGNITGIEGAKVAIAQGQLAAISILNSLGKSGFMTAYEAIEEVESARENAPIHFLPEIEKGREKIDAIWEKEGIL